MAEIPTELARRWQCQDRYAHLPLHCSVWYPWADSERIVAVAYINPDVLKWARERAGYSNDHLASLLHVQAEQTRAWESGGTQPPFAKAQTLADLLRIPFGFLFLPHPPKEAAPLPDLRTVEEGRTSVPSPDFMEVLNDALLKQEWFREYQKREEAAPLQFVGRFDIKDQPNVIAHNMSEELGIEHLRRASGTWDAYLRSFVRAAEHLGILVMRSGIVGSNVYRSLSVAEFRGFAISDVHAPLIFINSRDAKAAQIFTLAHELVHLWIGESGISNPSARSARQKNAIERLCNVVSAELLVPTDQFVRHWKNTSSESLQQLQRVFKVSRMVILRRAHDLGMLADAAFFRLAEEEQERQKERQKQQDEIESSGGNFYNTLPARNSVRFTEAVLEAYQRRTTPDLEAARLLNVRVATLPGLLDGLRASR